jgi:tRNA-Thr(GGU) m(6)t(6)A37 methyltransferase TsaA
MHNEESSSRSATITLSSIGIIHTPYQHSEGTPIQSSAANGSEGVIEIFPEFASGLRDIAGFDRLWLIYLLDRASAAQLLARPYLDTEQRGIFATRSPARPNHLGFSSVRLLAVEQNRLRISDVDMLDGTPLLDIKPYVPEFDCFQVTRTGWYAGRSAKGVVADDRFEAK